VQSSAVFAGQVLIRENLQVAGNLQVGGTLALNNITVSGTGQFGQASVSRNLAVTGDTAIQGAETIGKSLQVSGNGTFSGPLSAPQITTSSLQLTGDLVLTHHIIVGGSTPGRSNGPALGGGGSSSVSGSDTAGSISINTGSSPAAGCFVTINFSSAFSSTPHVLVTPIGSAAAGLAYYVNRSTTSFSVCTGTAAPASSSFGFDYFVLD
jgi:cytoskeletal protein CcmA (bactofilin family)